VEGLTLSYRGLYAHSDGELVKVTGKGPAKLQDHCIEKFLKYSSAKKTFLLLTGLKFIWNTFHGSVFGFEIMQNDLFVYLCILSIYYQWLIWVGIFMSSIPLLPLSLSHTQVYPHLVQLRMQSQCLQWNSRNSCRRCEIETGTGALRDIKDCLQTELERDFICSTAYLYFFIKSSFHF
jgi:hypothetical protein